MLAELIRAKQPCVVLTGAGISTESGIPDFRSPTGVWQQYDPLVVASIDGWRADPERVWEFYGRRLGLLADVQPNTGHRALAELERAGWVDAVITQNVDRLHEHAGSRTIVEVHGSLRTASCPACGAAVPMEEARGRLPLPTCDRCGGPLKPDVVMFGELLPAMAIERAGALARIAGCLVVVGSSLEVWPVAGLPAESLGAGGKLAIVNRDPTPYDDRADVVVRGGAGETLERVAAELTATRPDA
jgi:NAD-dependent protein deacetylase/lipoamidase